MYPERSPTTVYGDVEAVHFVRYPRPQISRVHARAISDEIGEQLRYATNMRPSGPSQRVLMLMQKLSKAGC
jgi:hypothetical protein